MHNHFHAPDLGLSSALSGAETAQLLPWSELTQELAAVSQAEGIQVPPRIVMALPHGASLFCMPASDDAIAITKLITLTPGNVHAQLPTIQGEITIFDIATGRRMLVIDGPTVTARRTAAISVLAAQHIAPLPSAPLLILGAGVQGQAHLEAFVDQAGTEEVWIASRSASSVSRLLRHAQQLGVRAYAVTNLQSALERCPNIVTCTSAREIVLRDPIHPQAFVAAVGAFTPHMAEVAPALVQRIARDGVVLVDTSEAEEEAGDLLQAGLDVASFPTLAQCLAAKSARPAGPVLFKSCGWGGWDLAAARLASRLYRHSRASGPDNGR